MHEVPCLFVLTLEFYSKYLRIQQPTDQASQHRRAMILQVA